MNTDTAANDLTQLSSREQLSALMDSALPADQTRFLLRRLQHDASLAECWERWRITGEVMRGLAPAQRMPAEFASRVSAALHGVVVDAPDARPARGQGWLRWGGGAAIAASLAVVALMARQAGPADASQAAPQVAAAAAQPNAPSSSQVQPSPMIDAGSQAAVVATALAAASNPPRKARRDALRSPARGQAASVRDATVEAPAQVAALETVVEMPQPDIVTRPWPRSVLPQYASGGLTVGFGEHVRGNAPYNPFQPQSVVGNLPPIAATGSDAGASGRTQPADGAQQDP